MYETNGNDAQAAGIFDRGGVEGWRNCGVEVQVLDIRSTPTHRRPNNKHHVVRSWLFDLTDNGTIGLSTTKDAASPTARLKHAPIQYTRDRSKHPH
ncbi:hypothetical protein Vi05172_g8938 [Venturia inaequalis]|nr:hypothetical protein Vi05172_g8938 [Venturia inaequalis]